MIEQGIALYYLFPSLADTPFWEKRVSLRAFILIFFLKKNKKRGGRELFPKQD